MRKIHARLLSGWRKTAEDARLDYPEGAPRAEQVVCLVRWHLVHHGLKPVHSFVLYGENESHGVTIHEGVGIRGRDAAPIDEAYQYNVASITQPVVANIILQLMEEGRLHLDDPVGEYLAHVGYLQFKKLHVLDGKSQAGEITVDHLLQHWSGH